MINVVGAGQDPDEATAATIYNFNSKPKSNLVQTTFVKTQDLQSIPKKTDSDPLLVLQTPPQQSPEKFPEKTAAVVTEPLSVVLPEPPMVNSEIPLPKNPVSVSVPIPKPNPLKKSLNVWLLATVLVILVIGIGVTIYLTQSNQDIRQQASQNLPADEILQKPTLALEPSQEPSQEPTPEISPAEPIDNATNLATSQNTSNPDLLALNNTISTTPTTEPTLIPTTEPTGKFTNTRTNCNDSCTQDTNCLNLAHSCHQGTCRLTSNLFSSSCVLASGGNQVSLDTLANSRTYSPYANPSGEAPVAGPADWLFYGLTGFGLLVFGGLALLAL